AGLDPDGEQPGVAQRRCRRQRHPLRRGPEAGPRNWSAELMRRRALWGLWFVLAWLVVAVPAWAVVFTHSSSEMVFASHDAVVHPTLDGYVRIDMGPYVPDLRTKSQSRIGVRVELRK